VNRSSKGIVTLLLTLLLAVCFSSFSLAESTGLVTSITVEGNVRVSERSIINRLLLKVGDPFNEPLLTPSVKALYRLGTFSRVAIDDQPSESGVALVVRVAERPMVTGVDIEGTEAIAENDLKSVLSMKTFSFYDPARTGAEIESLKSHYRAQGFHKVEVTAGKESEEKGVRLMYTVVEGEKTLITEIDVVGNREFTNHEITRVMAIKEVGPLSFMGAAGGFDENLVRDDLQRIKLLYMEKGYLDIQVSAPEISLHPDGSGLYVKLIIREGPQYRVGAIRYSGEWDELPDFVRSQPVLKEGDIFTRSLVVGDVQMLANSFRDRGHARARVEPLVEPDPASGRINLDLVLTKGPLVKVRWVEITGNYKTRDYVIRREMKIVEGDLFDQSKLDNSTRQVRSLGFFNGVNISVRDVDETNVDILVRVEEGSAGSFSAGMAYSSVDGLVGTLQLALTNFMGRGQRLNLDTELGGDVSTYTISFTEPRVFSGDYSLGADLLDKTRNYDEYSQDNRGGSVRVGYRFSDHSSASVKYKYLDYKVYDVAEDSSIFIQEQEGESTTSSLTLSYAYSAVDYPPDPTDGYRLSFSTEVAGGVLGGTNNFIRNRAEGSYFMPLSEKLVGSAHLELGSINAFDASGIPITERFFMGGLYSLRGFHHRSVGPEEDGEPVGGTKSLLLNLETTYPLMEDTGIKGVLFVDTGYVWADEEDVSLGDLRTGAGFGFRWSSPMGLLRLEWGFNLDLEPDETQPGWEFSIGNIF
jgi:outer membrane protein insertion porin family